MEKFKGTKGPWRVGIPGSVISDNSNGLTMGGATGEEAKKYYGGNLICESVSRVNAQLIAAAPDLIDALQRLVHLHNCEEEGILSGQPSATDWRKATNKARKAIDKAIGEQDGIIK